PELHTESNTYREHVVEFGGRNASVFAGTGTVYHGEFGDGGVADTAFPAASPSYVSAIVRDPEFNSFDVRLTVRRTGQPTAVAASTITLWNGYAFNKARGTLRPPSQTATATVPVSGAAQISVKNLENEALRFVGRRVDMQ